MTAPIAETLSSTSQIEHHTAIIVGGGPAGLSLAVVLGGWHPFFSESPILQKRYAQLADYLRSVPGSLLGMDFRQLVASQLPPVDLFRILHHPRQLFENLDQIAMDFRRGEALDYLLITQEEVGGLWNNVPKNLLTLSPGQWMELAFYPLAQHVEERAVDLPDVNELIVKHHLVDYYQAIPQRFGQEQRIRSNERVLQVEPHEGGFLLTTRDVSAWRRERAKDPTRWPLAQPSDDLGAGEQRQYTCKYLIYAAGQRCLSRQLGIPGEDLPNVHSHYEKAEDFPRDRALVIGGGRSADWAATELHDAGKQTYYAMRQARQRHWRLIDDSRGGLPYYARLADIMEADQRQFEALYETQITKFEPRGEATLATLTGNGESRQIEVDHVIKEIGSWPDYSLFQGFPEISLFEKHDPYRFQVHQMRTHPHNYESVDIPNLYAGGYLAQDIGLVVIAMHGTTYAIAGDILQKEGVIE